VTEVRRFLVLDGFVPRNPEDAWVEPAKVYEGERASNVLVSASIVRLFHPSKPGCTALVSAYFLTDLSPR
jgi:hypothetical protein